MFILEFFARASEPSVAFWCSRGGDRESGRETGERGEKGEKRRPLSWGLGEFGWGKARDFPPG